MHTTKGITLKALTSHQREACEDVARRIPTGLAPTVGRTTLTLNGAEVQAFADQLGERIRIRSLNGDPNNAYHSVARKLEAHSIQVPGRNYGRFS